MAVRYEWQTFPNGRRRFVRIVDDTPEAPRVPSKRTRPVAVVAEAPAPKKRGRPPKAKPAETPAPVVIEDESDDD
jgi:hypothetical protein